MIQAVFTTSISCPVAAMAAEATTVIRQLGFFELRDTDLHRRLSDRLETLERAAATLRPTSRAGAVFLALLAAADLDSAMSWAGPDDRAGALARSAHDALVGVVAALRRPEDAALVDFYMGRSFEIDDLAA